MPDIWVLIDEELTIHLLDCGDTSFRPGSIMMQVTPDTSVKDILTMVQMHKDGTLQEMKDRGLVN